MKIRRSMFLGVLAVLVAAMPALGLAQAASNLTVEQRLLRVEDELAIQRVLVEYAARQDARDYPGYAARWVDTPVMPTSQEWMKFIRDRKAGGQ